MRKIDSIIIHCSATKGDVDIETIRFWHLEKGWRDVGYHYLIRSNGSIEAGRPLEQTGAHTKGHNKDSIGICIAGGFDGTTDDYTPEQWHSLETLVGGLCAKYKIYTDSVHGHNYFTDSKTCPNFDVSAWWLLGETHE